MSDPVRTCVGCRRRAQVNELQRCALSATGDVIASSDAPGRGAWLCRGSLACLERAASGRRFDRAFRRTVSAPAYDAFRKAFASGTWNVRQSTSSGDAAMTSAPPMKG